MEPEVKTKAFEYLSSEFFKWFNELEPAQRIEDNFSKLKLFKLHFFVCAATASTEHDGLLRYFDNFYALPYGHVESTIYGNLELVNSFSFGKNSIQKKDFPVNYFDDISDVKSELDSAISSLRAKNKDIVRYNAMELVELSHTWNSWISIFNIARQMGKFSMRIPIEMIKNETKRFIIN